jgi:hypothetical protein
MEGHKGRGGRARPHLLICHSIECAKLTEPVLQGADDQGFVLSCAKGMRLKPQRPGHRRRLNRKPPPPFGLVAATMSLAMMSATQGDGELIADLAAEGAALGKAQVVGVRGLAAADQAGALDDRPDMVAVANPARLGQGEQALVDRSRLTLSMQPSSFPTILALQPSRGYLFDLRPIRSTRRKGA